MTTIADEISGFQIQAWIRAAHSIALNRKAAEASDLTYNLTQ